MRNMTIAALLFTAVWIGGVVTLVCFKWNDFSELSPNEWGDFLGGSTISPLALIWLVVGYLQQGKELRLNTKALRSQQIELSNQVAETRKLAEHAELQAQATVAMRVHTEQESARAFAIAKKERAERNKPDFILKINKVDGHKWDVDIFNQGGDAFTVRVRSEYFDIVILSGDVTRFRNNTQRKIELKQHSKDLDESPFLFIDCWDVDNDKYTFMFAYDSHKHLIVAFPW